MNPKFLELALKKQRLQFEVQLQRQDLARDLAGLSSVLHTVDHVRDGLDWIRRHVRVLAAGAAAVAIVRPRFALRFGRRIWLGWLLYRRTSVRFAPLLAPILAEIRRVRQAAASRH